MDLSGLGLMLLGIGLLLCMRDHASVQRELQRWLFRVNYPRLSRRYPRIADGWGTLSARTAFVMGIVIGTAAIVGGAIIAFN